MTTNFDTFCESRFGEFFESMLGERGCEERCPEIDTGGCCIANTNMVGWDGQCVDYVTAGECTRLDGEYAGDGIPCSRDQCFTLPDDSDIVGQCCGSYDRHELSDTWTHHVQCAFGVTNAECNDWWIPGCEGPTLRNCGRDSWRAYATCPDGNLYDGAVASCGSSQGWCCIPEPIGARYMTTSEECSSRGGDFSMSGTDPCPMPHCCLADETGWIHNITVLQPADCTIQGGFVWNGITCPVGSCCLPCGRCIDNVTTAQCGELRGEHLGTGTLCPNTCEETTGACCLPFNVCLDSTRRQCDTLVGDYQGDNTTCLAGTCPLGICCKHDGACLEGLTFSECVAVPGRYLEPPATCATSTCRGSCCQLDGSCVDNLAIDECNFHVSIGKACSETDCLGACCLDSGQCVWPRTVPECGELSGTFMGVGSTCEGLDCVLGDWGGACCLWSGGCEQVRNEAACMVGGRGVFMGGDTSCDDPALDCSATAGACCFDWDQCVNTWPGLCGQQQGEFQGAGTTCAGTTCPQMRGACCSTTGLCNETDPRQCHQAGGEFHGTGSTCDDTDCGPDRVCCLPDGTCDITGLLDCMERDGVWNYFAPPSWCSSGTCNFGWGACCISQRCHDASDMTYALCVSLGGKFFGADSTCASGNRDCTPGACCLPDGTCADDQTQNWCNNRGGKWCGVYDQAFFRRCRDVDCETC